MLLYTATGLYIQHEIDGQALHIHQGHKKVWQILPNVVVNADDKGRHTEFSCGLESFTRQICCDVGIQVSLSSLPSKYSLSSIPTSVAK